MDNLKRSNKIMVFVDGNYVYKCLGEEYQASVLIDLLHTEKTEGLNENKM